MLGGTPLRASHASRRGANGVGRQPWVWWADSARRSRFATPHPGPPVRPFAHRGAVDGPGREGRHMTGVLRKMFARNPPRPFFAALPHRIGVPIFVFGLVRHPSEVLHNSPRAFAPPGCIIPGREGVTAAHRVSSHEGTPTRWQGKGERGASMPLPAPAGLSRPPPLHPPAGSPPPLAPNPPAQPWPGLLLFHHPQLPSPSTLCLPEPGHECPSPRTGGGVLSGGGRYSFPSSGTFLRQCQTAMFLEEVWKKMDKEQKPSHGGGGPNGMAPAGTHLPS